LLKDTSDISPNLQSNTLIQPPTILEKKEFLDDENESDEEYDYVPRSTSFLRFGRQSPPSSASFLRFGRSNPSFLRFGRAGQNGGTFLRFGRQQPSSSNFLRFGKKGEFLRFG
jgi:hypothetical protein